MSRHLTYDGTVQLDQLSWRRLGVVGLAGWGRMSFHTIIIVGLYIVDGIVV